MRFSETLRMTFVNLAQNKFKALLTSLGIVIGTLTIILVIAIGRGGEEQIAAQFKNMSAETIYVNLNYLRGMPDDYKLIPRITPQHLEQIQEENPYLESIYLRAGTYMEVQMGGEKEYMPISAVTHGYTEISNLNFKAGDDFSEEEMEDASAVCVIGHTLAEKYFSFAEDAPGQYIRIDGRQYEIVGVLERTAEGLQGLNPDDSVFLPFQTAQDNGLLDEYTIPQAVGLAKDLDNIQKAMARIESTLDYVLENASYYIVEDAGSRIDAATQSARTMKMLLTSVAAIVFLVGGIGIMNVLFVSVKERTREIGILKALGTQQRDILLQFLLESVLMGIIGGIVGCIIGIALLPLMQYTDIPVAFSLSGPLLAMAFAFVTAAVFGFYPAYKASILKPIEALNYD